MSHRGSAPDGAPARWFRAGRNAGLACGNGPDSPRKTGKAAPVVRLESVRAPFGTGFALRAGTSIKSFRGRGSVRLGFQFDCGRIGHRAAPSGSRCPTTLPDPPYGCQPHFGISFGRYQRSLTGQGFPAQSLPAYRTGQVLSADDLIFTKSDFHRRGNRTVSRCTGRARPR